MARQGFSVESLLEQTEVPAEFLRDPSCWLESHKVESFLNLIEKEFRDKMSDQQLIETVGHQCHELWGWGVLDSVLRMMTHPTDIYQQPHKFLSYFVSPSDEVCECHREDESVSFTLSWSRSDFPLVAEYLKSALEGLPAYLGKPRSIVKWDDNQVFVGWSIAQQSFFNQKQEESNFKPELVSAMRQSLEIAQKELEERKRELVIKDKIIEQYKNQNTKSRSVHIHDPQNIIEFANSWKMKDRMESISSRIKRLEDYLIRSQQLVTLLVGQKKNDPQLEIALKRVDWEHICSTYKRTVETLSDDLVALLVEWKTGNLPRMQENDHIESDYDQQRTLDQQLNL